LTTSGNTSAQREVGVVSYNASINTTTTLGSDYSTYSPIGAASANVSSGIYVSGGSTGTVYTTLGTTSTPPSTNVLETQTATRSVEIINGQLYISTNNYTTPLFIDTVGTGLPTSGTQSVTQLSGLVDAAHGVGVGGPYSFAFATLNAGSSSPDTLYIADTYNYGVDKYSLVGSTWTFTGEAGGTSSGTLAKVTDVIAEAVPSGEQLFMSTPAGIYSYVDTAGYNAASTTFNSTTPTLTTVSLAPTNDQFRGIAFVPQPGGAPTIFSNPTNQSAIVGTSATFTASAYGDNLGVQWYVNKNDGNGYVIVPGATYNTLTVSGLTTAQNGYTYKATFTNAAGSVSSNPATLTVQVAPQFSFDASSYTVNENAGTVTIEVDRGGATTTAASVSYSTGGGTATSANYTSTSGTLNFTATGPNQLPITVPITALYPQGGDKTFNVSLSSPTNSAVLASPSVTTVTIHDISENFSFSTSAYTVNENASGGTAEFTITRSEDVSDVGSVVYTTSDGTAKAGTNYSSTSGTVSFAAGQVYGTFSVPITKVSPQNGNKTFTVTLSADPNFTTGNTILGTNASATETIVDTAPLTNNASATAATTTDIQTTGVYTTYPAYIPVNGTAAAGSGFANANLAVLEYTAAGSPALYPAAGQQVTALSNLTLEIYNTAITGNYGGDPGNFNIYYLASSESAAPTSLFTFQTSDVGGLNGQGGAILLGTFSFDNNPVGFDYFTPSSLSTTVTNDILAALNSNAPIRFAVTPGASSFAADWQGENGANTPTLNLTDTVTTTQQQETVGFASSSISIPETAGQTSIAVTRTGPTADTETVAYTFTNGTAVAGTNYNGASGTLTFGPGVTSVSIPLTAIDVTPQGGDKTLTLTLSSPSTTGSSTVGVLGTNASATVIITDSTDSQGTETLTEYSSDVATVETTGPYAASPGPQSSATLGVDGTANTYPSYAALDFNNTDYLGTNDEFTPAAMVTGINSITLEVYNASPAIGTSGPINVYLVPDATSNIDPSNPESKNPHFFDQFKYPIEGLDTTALPSTDTNTFGTPMLLGSVYWTATATTQTTSPIPLTLTSYNTAAEQALISDLNGTTKFRLVITPENASVHANFAGYYYNANNVLEAPQLSIGVQEGAVSSGLPAWVAPGSVATWNASSSTLTVTGATTIISDPVTNMPTIIASGSAAAITVAPTAGDYVSEIHIGALNLSNGASLTLSTTSAGDHLVLVTSGINTLSIDSTSKLDLTNNYLDVAKGSLSTITSEVAEGFNGGTWTGNGITSSTAAAAGNHLTAVAVISNSTGTGTGAIYNAFDGAPVASTDILVKYTYYGDANIDGQVDGSDYTKIDAGFGSAGVLTGWGNGDFNYDGKIDGSDYTLIDNAFNTQSARFVYTAAQIVSPASKFSSAAPIAAIPTSATAAAQPSIADLLDSDKKNTLAGIVDSIGKVTT
jgi:hypothetical protein